MAQRYRHDQAARSGGACDGAGAARFDDRQRRRRRHRGGGRLASQRASDRIGLARFYEIGSNRPIYSGRDGIVKYNLLELEDERRLGYAWLGNWPQALLADEYPARRARLR